MGNPFRRETPFQYRSRRADELASAKLEQSIRDEQTRVGRKNLERMPDERSLFAYLNPDAVSADEMEIDKYAAARELGRRMRTRPPGELGSRVPKAKSREQLCQNIFACNVWDAEPVLLDDLREAKQNGSEEEVNRVREMVRAASWMHHPRTDQAIAKRVAQELFDEAEAEHERRKIKSVKGSQTELSFMDPDRDALEAAVIAISDLSCEADAEAALNGIEGSIERAWQDFLVAYESTPARDWPGGKKDWPDRGADLPQSLVPHMKRLTKLRQLRDQLSYQRLYPRLCHIAWEHRK